MKTRPREAELFPADGRRWTDRHDEAYSHF